MEKGSKVFLGLGTLTAVALPVAAVVACGDSNSKEKEPIKQGARQRASEQKKVGDNTSATTKPSDVFLRKYRHIQDKKSV